MVYEEPEYCDNCGGPHNSSRCFDGELSDDGDIKFADPGGNSALRAGVRDQRCPSCKFPNRLTIEDVRLGYQCDACADALERGIDAPYNEEYEEEVV